MRLTASKHDAWITANWPEMQDAEMAKALGVGLNYVEKTRHRLRLMRPKNKARPASAYVSPPPGWNTAEPRESVRRADAAHAEGLRMEFAR